MNDAVYKFKRYEDSSLEYTGINTHTGTLIGGWDTVIDTADMNKGSVEEINAKKVDELPDVASQEVEKRPEQKKEPWELLKVGGTVIHKSFGQGVVMSLDEKYVIVRFKDRESKFPIVFAFEKGYISL